MSLTQKVRPRTLFTAPRPQTSTGWHHHTCDQVRSLAPLKPQDADPLPPDFWLIHRWLKGGVR